MRRAPGLGTTSFSIISGAQRRLACLMSTSAIGSRDRSACSTRSVTARSNGSARPGGSGFPGPSRARSSAPLPLPGARTPSPSKAAARTVRLAASNSTSSPDLRRALVALAASASLICSPLRAQESEPEPTLEELIPDEAVANPEAWAEQGVPPEDQATADAAGEPDPDSPLADV